MSRGDVPWYAALYTTFGIVWGVMVLAAWRSETLSGVIVLLLPAACFAIWFAVKAIMMRVLFSTK